MRFPRKVGGTHIPVFAAITTGSIELPWFIRSYHLTAVEEVFRNRLWPPLARGMVRFGRQFRWSDDGRILYYRIIDTPGKSQTWRLH